MGVKVVLIITGIDQDAGSFCMFFLAFVINLTINRKFVAGGV